MALQLFSSHFKKADLAEFCQKMAMLLETGYDTTAAVEMLAQKSIRRKDRSAEGVRKVAELLLPNLREGFRLHEAMANHQKQFGNYVHQVEVGEESGKTEEVLQRISDQIKNASKIMNKLKGALAYPIFTLLFTFAAALYLFTNVIPDMLDMLVGVGIGELPLATKIVMAAGDWMKANGVFFFTVIFILVATLFIYSRTIGKHASARFATKIPFLGRVIENSSLNIYFNNWCQMILAGAEMSVALKSAAESVPNLYIRRLLTEAYEDYTENGIAVHEALRPVLCIRDLELQSIQVALEGRQLHRTLKILADDREYEANKSINAMTAAVNPILLLFVGLIVGTLVMSVYGPIISVSSSLGA